MLQVLWGRPSISQELGGLIFDISARSFFQTNTAQAVQLTRMVVAAAGDTLRWYGWVYMYRPYTSRSAEWITCLATENAKLQHT